MPSKGQNCYILSIKLHEKYHVLSHHKKVQILYGADVHSDGVPKLQPNLYTMFEAKIFTVFYIL